MFEIALDFSVQLAVAFFSGVALIIIGYHYAKERRFKKAHNIATSGYGIQFVQNEKRMPVVHRGDHDEVHIKPQPFEIRIRRPASPNIANTIALCVAISIDKEIWANTQAAVKPVGYFSGGLAKIDREYGSGILSYSEYTKSGKELFSYNYVAESRFNSSNESFLGFYVSAITDKPAAYFEVNDKFATGVPADLHSENTLKGGTKYYAIFVVKRKTDKGMTPDKLYERVLIVVD